MMASTHRTGSVALASGMIAFLPTIAIPSQITDFVYIPTTYNVILAGEFVSLALLGGLLPDADIPQSTIGRKLYVLLFPMYVLKFFLRLLGNFFKPIKKISQALGHRGIFHSLLFWTVIFAVLSAFNYKGNIFVGCAISGLYFGILSHIMLDLISGGVPLIAPISMKRQRFPLYIKTGGFLEMIFNVVFVVLTVGMIYMTIVNLNGGLL